MIVVVVAVVAANFLKGFYVIEDNRSETVSEKWLYFEISDRDFILIQILFS